MKILRSPTKEELNFMRLKLFFLFCFFSFKILTYMNGKYKNLKLPKINAKPWATVFKNKNNDPLYIDLVSKLLVYEPESRLTPYKTLCHPYFDDLRKSDIKLPNGKSLPSHIFKFKQCEINCDKDSIEFLLSQID